jgi:hypothetical protein
MEDQEVICASYRQIVDSNRIAITILVFIYKY